MKRFAILLLLAGCVVPLAQAQDEEHVQVGVFADYLRLDQTATRISAELARGQASNSTKNSSSKAK